MPSFHHTLLSVLLLQLQHVHSFSTSLPHPRAPTPLPRRLPTESQPSRSRDLQMFGPGGGGGFLNLGTPEVIVIGAVAWALLGPKELYRLARQAGEFLGEWQQLGAQARDTFKDALETELREDELKAKASEVASPFSKFTPSALQENVAPLGVPSLAEMAEKKKERGEKVVMPDLGEGKWTGDLGREVSEEEKAELYRQAVAEMGDPESNKKAFQEQISGERNAAVLQEFPQELNYEDWASDPLKPDEELLETQIQEAENRIEMLRAEAKVLALRRQQQQANAERAQKLAEEQAVSAAEDTTSKKAVDA